MKGKLNPLVVRERRYWRLQKACWAITQIALAEGLIEPVAGKACVDCGAAATEYDHRDYCLPIAVEPTCRSCNSRRGRAKPFTDLPLRITKELREAA